ncbi:hypothetical protein [Nonomuraea sp. NEAU-A123]|uniref:hypothetical protein n=1 Tax=Nonomuraea sp. NEAU-A123 TaxID=2839649 RepID=UPI001BE4248C|nr:hypothetical protein [Nonomuraea sp. NEAU-A123]MBT2231691.1 hypothetical protein [Nonomuraea sp. NEAU-A123]
MAAADVQVPYITPHSAEKVDLGVVFARYNGATDGRRLSYPDPNDDDWQMGVLWARQEDHRRGAPLWDQVHSLRQRECMLNELCQVCRETAREPSSGRLWWVFPRAVPVASMYVTKPATCAGCIPKAIAFCPRLRIEAHIYTSNGVYEPYGVLGDVVTLSTDGATGLSRNQDVPLDAFHRLEYTLARALTVHVRDLRREPIPRAGPATGLLAAVRTTRGS